MISEEAEKALLRLVEAGVSESAERLGKLSRTSWQTQTVSIREVAFDKFSDTSGDAENYGSYFSMPGGVFVVMFPKNGASRLARAFEPKGPPATQVAEDWVRSCLAEIANIIVHAVANMMGDACGDVFFLSAPTNAAGKRKDLIAAAPSKFPQAGKTFVLMAYVHMQADTLASDCSFVLLLSGPRRDRLLKALDG